jgi:hypothetical protein
MIVSAPVARDHDGLLGCQEVLAVTSSFDDSLPCVAQFAGEDRPRLRLVPHFPPHGRLFREQLTGNVTALPAGQG